MIKYLTKLIRAAALEPLMKKPALVITLLVAFALLIAALKSARRAINHSPPAAIPKSVELIKAEAHPSLIHGRVTTIDGTVYQGRLRWGGLQEAFWGDYFNGDENENPWAHFVPPARLPKQRETFRIFGLQVFDREDTIGLGRPFMVRFGDIARIEANASDVRVIMKSGSVTDLRRSSASDLDDGLLVWDPSRGTTSLDSLLIRSIEFLPSPAAGIVPDRLYGAVRTRHDSFAGFIQWNRELSLGSDLLIGKTADGEQKLPFNTIRSIARHSNDSSMVTLIDGRQIRLSDTSAVGEYNRGAYVDDPRYGRVLVPWDAFEIVEFTPAPEGPAYNDFPPGDPLAGAVTTHDGRRLAGRLVFDLDESETVETLDAPCRGVDYTIPFGLVASIELPVPGTGGEQRARVTLNSGEKLALGLSGDLGKNNAGLLIFTDPRQNPEYVVWSDVAQIKLDRPPAMYPPPAKR